MRMAFHTTDRAATRCGVALLLLLLAGCAAPMVSPPRVAAFGQAVDSVKLQFDTAFAAINQMAMADAVERAVTLPKLTEADVAPLLPPDDIAKWDNAIGGIDAYVASLTALTAPNPANDFGSAATAFGTAVAKLEPSALPSPGVAAGFAELGRSLIAAKAERDALKIARQADPAMQQIFTAMADVIGDAKLKGLRGTVHEHWQTEIAEVAKVDFPTAKGNTAARRSAVLAYVDLLQKRDAQDLQLASLRQSLLELGVAHAALARGDDIDLAGALAMTQQELNATRAFFDAFSALKPKPSP
jgi:hypothetical protein